MVLVLKAVLMFSLLRIRLIASLVYVSSLPNFILQWVAFVFVFCFFFLCCCFVLMEPTHIGEKETLSSFNLALVKMLFLLEGERSNFLLSRTQTPCSCFVLWKQKAALLKLI